jgi:hypothetical protein
VEIGDAEIIQSGGHVALGLRRVGVGDPVEAGQGGQASPNCSQEPAIETELR